MLGNDTKREPLLTTAYFDESIAYEEIEGIPRFEHKLAGGTLDKKGRARLRYTLFKKRLHLLISRYSRGDAIQTLPPLFPIVVEALAQYHAEECHEPFNLKAVDDYQTALWLLSLSALLKVPTTLHAQVVALLNITGQDALVDTLIHKRTPLPQTSTPLIHAKLVQTLYAATQTTTPADQVNAVRQFLAGWYGNRREMYWHDDHKGPEGGGFFGHWALEAAAVVTLLGIDDSTFRNARYYPGDLVW